MTRWGMRKKKGLDGFDFAVRTTLHFGQRWFEDLVNFSVFVVFYCSTSLFE